MLLVVSSSDERRDELIEDLGRVLDDRGQPSVCAPNPIEVTGLGRYLQGPLEAATPDTHARAELLLQAAALAEFCDAFVMPALRRGSWVLAGGTHHRLIAEYGTRRGLGALAVANVCGFASFGVVPGKIFCISGADDELEQQYIQALSSATPLLRFLEHDEMNRSERRELMRQDIDELFEHDLERAQLMLHPGAHPRAYREPEDLEKVIARIRGKSPESKQHNRDHYSRLLHTLSSPESEPLTDKERSRLIAIADALASSREDDLAPVNALIAEAAGLVEEVQQRSGWSPAIAWSILADLIATSEAD